MSENRTLPVGRGARLLLRRGESVTLALPFGPQVVDLNVHSAREHRIAFSSSTTRMAYGLHLGVGMSLLAGAPDERPLLTIVDQELHEGRDGFAAHDVAFGPCSRAYRLRNYGRASDGCFEILSRQMTDWGNGLGSPIVHDPLNLFMYTRVSEQDRLEFIPSLARKGDFVRLIAERDCHLTLSVCPGRSSGPEHHEVVVDAPETSITRS